MSKITKDQATARLREILSEVGQCLNEMQGDTHWPIVRETLINVRSGCTILLQDINDTWETRR